MAVTFGRTKQTPLIDMEQSSCIQIIKIAHHSNAVGSDGQILVISGGEKTTKVNLNDMSLKTLLKSELKYAVFII